MSIKAVGIAIKLTLEGSNQAAHLQTWVFVTISVLCIISQLNYLNKVNFFINLFMLVSLLFSFYSSMMLEGFEVFLVIKINYVSTVSYKPSSI